MLREIAQPDIVMGNPALALPVIAGEKQAEILDAEIAALEGNIHILTSDERGIARRERVLGIIPLDTDTLQERAYKVLVKWYDTYPYTLRDLAARLDRLCGKDAYEIIYDKADKFLQCLIELKSKKMVAAINDLLESIVPLDVAFQTRLRYRTWDSFPGMTWAGFEGMTWYEMATQVDEEED
jgi:hypothetical protein